MSNDAKKRIICVGNRYRPEDSAGPMVYDQLVSDRLPKDIEVIEELSEKKKEFIAKIRTDTLFGKQTYYLISKEKKRVNTNDLTIALQHSQTQKMPALFISPGELDKKAQEHLKEWQNLIKFQQINI